jgi:Fe2+ transport system protein B
MRYGPEIVEYAKELYLTVDSKGNRVYSFENIATEIKRKFNVEINKTTVYHWAKKKGWDKLLQQAIVVSAYDEESKRETEATITKVVEKLPADEELIEKLARAKRWVVINHLKMAKKLYAEVQKKNASDKGFARLCEVADRVGKSVYEMLSAIDEKEQIQTPIVIINEIDPTQVSNPSEGQKNAIEGKSVGERD